MVIQIYARFRPKSKLASYLPALEVLREGVAAGRCQRPCLAGHTQHGTSCCACQACWPCALPPPTPAAVCCSEPPIFPAPPSNSPPPAPPNVWPSTPAPLPLCCPPACPTSSLQADTGGDTTGLAGFEAAVAAAASDSAFRYAQVLGAGGEGKP